MRKPERHPMTSRRDGGAVRHRPSVTSRIHLEPRLVGRYNPRASIDDGVCDVHLDTALEPKPTMRDARRMGDCDTSHPQMMAACERPKFIRV